METPRIVAATRNAFVATRAALLCAQAADPPIAHLGFPGMCTGIGAMDPFEAARQMCEAFVEVLSPVPVDDSGS